MMIMMKNQLLEMLVIDLEIKFGDEETELFKKNIQDKSVINIIYRHLKMILEFNSKQYKKLSNENKEVVKK